MESPICVVVMFGLDNAPSLLLTLLLFSLELVLVEGELPLAELSLPPPPPQPANKKTAEVMIKKTIRSLFGKHIFNNKYIVDPINN